MHRLTFLLRDITWRVLNDRHKISKMLEGILALALLVLCGCDYHHYVIPRDSYTLQNRFYTFAIYNDAGQLLTHPLLDLERTLKAFEPTKSNPSKQADFANGRGCRTITDVYVMSHGWNYSAGEAVANYHNYIELLDRLREKQNTLDEHEPFCPYLILVTWTSTTRPVEDLATGILPFNLGELIRPVGYITDRFILHPITAWQQSFRASTIALGSRFPDSYLYRPWYYTDGSQTDLKEYGTESPYFLDRDTGYDAPLSAMLYELIKWKTAPKPAGPSLEGIPIHLVGHSYGAKLVALASMEALRRWILIDHLLGERFSGDDKLGDLQEVVEHWLGRYIGWSKKKSTEDKLFEDWNQLLKDTGHGIQTYLPIHELVGEKYRPSEDKASKEIEKAIFGPGRSGQRTNASNDPDHSFPISSLLLINPAMHPGELWYPVNINYTAPAATLRLIPRKAVLYSKHDFTNGILFNLREALLDVQGSYRHQVLLNDLSYRTEWTDRDNPKLRTFSSPFTGIFNGPTALVYSAIHGTILHIGTTAANLPYDLWYHIRKNHWHSDWMPSWIGWDAPEDRKNIGSFIGRASNFVDFFVPKLPFGPIRDEDLLGITRLSRPALGKTGLNRLVAGRPNLPNLYGLQPFNHPDIGADESCRYMEQLAKENYKRPSDEEIQRNSGRMRNTIFSFDASKVYNDWKPPVGAHDDVRSREDQTSCTARSFSTEDSEQLDIWNGLLAEVKARLRLSFEADRSWCIKSPNIECANLKALHSLEVVDIERNSFSIAVSLAPFEELPISSSAARDRLQEFWEEIQAPLTTELASECAARLRSCPSLKLTHIIKLEKRESSFGFILRFTKGYFDSDLLRKEAQ